MRLLALDCSLADTGAVVMDDAGWVVYALGVKPPPALRGIQRCGWIGGVVLDLARSQFAERVVIEGYSYASTLVAHQLGELGGVVRYLFWRAEIPVEVMAPGAWKKVALGKGNLDKSAVKLEVFKRYGFEHQDQNVIDAYGLARGWWLQQTSQSKPRIPRGRAAA